MSYIYFFYFTKFELFAVDIQQFGYFTLLMGTCYEDTPLISRELLCPASEFQALLCNEYPITNGGYINDNYLGRRQ